MSDPIVVSDPIVSTPLCLRLGRTVQERQEAYRQLFKAAVPKDDLSAIRDSTHKGWALGSERFVKRIEALSQRRAVSKGVGRPKVNELNRV